MLCDATSCSSTMLAAMQYKPCIVYTCVLRWLSSLTLEITTPTRAWPVFYSVPMLVCLDATLSCDWDHDGRWSTYDENVLKLSRVSFLGVIRALQSNINICYPPQLGAPHLSLKDLPGMPRSWCLLSITGLAALVTAKHYGTPSEAYIIRQIWSAAWVIFLQPARRPSVWGHFSSLRPHRLWPSCPTPSKWFVPLYYKSKAQTRHVSTI